MNKATRLSAHPVGAEVTDINEVREYKRIPWSGNLDEAELERPGGLLLAALIRCANERREQLNDMARGLGITYGYINQLRNGVRQVSQISDDFALACAHYLGVPRLTVLMLAGRISPADAYEPEALAAAEIPRAMKFMCDDPEWGPMIPPEVRAGSHATQFLILRLYEQATGKVLLPERLSTSTLAAEIEKLQELQATRRRQVAEYVARKARETTE